MSEKADERPEVLDDKQRATLRTMLETDPAAAAAQIGLSVPTLARAVAGLRVQHATLEVIRMRLQAGKAA